MRRARRSVADLVRRQRDTLLGRVILAYGDSGAANYAAMIAFNAFMAILPVTVELMAILSLLGRNHGFELRLENAIVQMFPSVRARSNVLMAVTGVEHIARLLGLLALIALVWTGSSFFTAMEFSLDQIYGIGQRAIVRQQVTGILMLLLFLVVLLLSVAASTVLAFLPFVSVASVFITAALVIGMLVLVYRVVPNRRQAWSEVWPGAVLAGVLIEVLTLIWPLYAKLVHDPNAYDQTLALLFLFGTWLYFLSALVLLGAVFNKSLRRAPG